MKNVPGSNTYHIFKNILKDIGSRSSALLCERMRETVERKGSRFLMRKEREKERNRQLSPRAWIFFFT